MFDETLEFAFSGFGTRLLRRWRSVSLTAFTLSDCDEDSPY